MVTKQDWNLNGPGLEGKGVASPWAKNGLKQTHGDTEGGIVCSHHHAGQGVLIRDDASQPAKAEDNDTYDKLSITWFKF